MLMHDNTHTRSRGEKGTYAYMAPNCSDAVPVGCPGAPGVPVGLAGEENPGRCIGGTPGREGMGRGMPT